MSTAAERMRAKAARLNAATAPPAKQADDVPETSPPPSARAVRADPIRSTVDLSPHHHALLKAWCGESAVELGRSRVTTQDVLRALVARLLTDETLARRIRQDIQATTR